MQQKKKWNKAEIVGNYDDACIEINSDDDKNLFRRNPFSNTGLVFFRNV